MGIGVAINAGNYIYPGKYDIYPGNKYIYLGKYAYLPR